MSKQVFVLKVSDDMMEVRADKLLALRFKDLSRTRLQKCFDKKQVFFGDKVINKCYKISEPGTIKVFFEETKKHLFPEAVPIPLNIQYEDDSIIVINKCSGMVIHPGNGTSNDTLVHALLHHCDGKLSTVGSPLRPGIVHRLDKETSGLVVAAKSDLSHYKLADAFSNRLVKKKYYVIISGQPKLKSGICTESIGRHPIHRTKMTTVNEGKGRHAHTEWRVIDTIGKMATLIECNILTGRTHQIRVHMSNLGFPILGDTLYGFKKNNFKNIEIKRVFLHSSFLEFNHPISGEVISFSLELPNEFKRIIEIIRDI